jgi:phosphatidylserine decarboxylase
MNILQQEDLNFLLTNRIPRRAATRAMGWFSRIENRALCAVSLRIWRLFTDLDLSDAEHTAFTSLHQCFTRRLKPGARPIDSDPAILVSPCDAIVGAHGTVVDGHVLQVKGFVYAVAELLADPDLAERFQGGTYVTLRLTSAMYHRFHAPHDCHVSMVTYLSGDTWNVNPVALKRVDRLYCKNERAVIQTRLTASGYIVTLVPVAAILVAGIRLRFMELQRPVGAASITACDVSLHKGEEMGWFEHGSTIIVFAPAGFTPCANLQEGAPIRMGEPLLHLPG